MEANGSIGHEKIPTEKFIFYSWETQKNSTHVGRGGRKSFRWIPSDALERNRFQWKSQFSIRRFEKQVSWVALATSNSDVRESCGGELKRWYHGECCWEFRPFLETTVCFQNVNVVFWTMQGIHSWGICGSLVHAQEETQIVDKTQL